MFSAMKKMWRYLRNYKFLLILSILTLIINSFLIFLSPLIIKKILDEHIVGISNYAWVEVEKEQEKAVEYNNSFYVQTRYVENYDSEDLYYIFVDDVDFYLTSYDIINDDYSYENGMITGDNGEKYPLFQLSNEELVDFYRPSFKPLLILIFLLLIRALASSVFGYIQRRSNAEISINIVRDARKDAAESVHKLSMDDIESEPAGKLSSRLISDVSGLMMMFSLLMNIVFGATISFIFAVIGMFYLNSTLAIVFLATMPIIFIWINIFVKKIRKIANKVSETNSLIIAHVNEVINGVNILKIFGYQKPTSDKFNLLSNEFCNDMNKEVETHVTIGWNLIELTKSFATVTVVIYFTWLKFDLQGAVITAGLIYAYNDYIVNAINPLNLMFRQFGELQHSIVKTNRLFDLIDSGNENNEISYIPRFSGDVKFDDVSFSYTDDEKNYVLKNINLEIEKGQFIGIVGQTGSGKSTMMNLLMRFNDLGNSAKGHIFVDDININTLPKRSYRQHVGIILQEPVLFSGTIASNIIFGKAGIYDRDVEKVIELIGANKLIDKFPKGILQEVEFGGNNLSVGEKQIISFARVLIHDPAVIIMDEATANIDTETEKLLQKALNVVSENRTTIIIAHRLSTIMNADQIIVMDNGEIIEKGTHKELIRNDYRYANMYRSQVEV